MNVTSSELRARARGALRGEYGYALLACLIVTAITGVIAGIGGGSSINISNMDFRELQDLMNGGAGTMASETFNVRFSPISGVVSLASLLIGRAFMGKGKIPMRAVGAVMGAFVFRLVYTIALRFNMPTFMLKLVSSVIVIFAIFIPYMKSRVPILKRKAAHASGRGEEGNA